MAKAPKILTFDQAIKASCDYSRRHLLLGNGFSIACRPNIFVYGKLFEQADFTALSKSAKEAFGALGTTDFERVIKTLRDTATIADVYKLTRGSVDQIHQDAERLKELLVQTIAKSHPGSPSEIEDKEYAHCQTFLANFSTIYTLNYDLLLYWTQMHHESSDEIKSDDGFRTSEDDIESGFESQYVVWEADQSYNQNTWFLHGALHIFDSGTEIQKYTWSRTGIRLIDQTRDALSKNLFPLFVAEGESHEKIERIRHSDYLAKASRSFHTSLHQSRNCLFIYGHSLAANDEHFLKTIEETKFPHLLIGLHGNPNSDGNKAIVRRAELMQVNRPERWPLQITYFDSGSAEVWGRK
jgi:hypothetical protein